MAKEQISPVSFAQQRLMFLDRLDSGTSAYNLTRVIRVAGALDTTALAQTLTRIAQRQASLRTRFVFEAQDGYQIVDESVEFRSLAIDLSHLPEVEREPAAMRLAREVGAEKFDLAVAPLFRCAVIRLCADRCLLVLVMHHIVTDGWSMSTLFEEIGAKEVGQ